MVKNRKVRRVWKIVSTVICSLVIYLIAVIMLAGYELWTPANMAIWTSIITLVSFGIFLTWKYPKWIKSFDNRLERCAKKLRALIFEKEEKHNNG